MILNRACEFQHGFASLQVRRIPCIARKSNNDGLQNLSIGLNLFQYDFSNYLSIKVEREKILCVNFQLNIAESNSMVMRQKVKFIEIIRGIMK